MFRVLDCLTTQHDWRLVVAAGSVIGAQRMAWGSNYPTSPGTLAEILATAQAGLASLSDEDREWIFGKTAQQLYPALA